MKKLFAVLSFFCACSLHAQISVTFDDTTYKRFVTIDTTDYHHNLWQVGAPHKTVFDSAYSRPNAIVTDTAHPYAASDTSVFIVKAPTYAIGGFVFSLGFWYQLDLDSNALARVEISGDSGHTWIDIIKDTTGVFSWSFGTGVKPNFDTSTRGWQQFNVTFLPFLDSISADTTLFRFTFQSSRNDSNRDGWIIDNIGVGYYHEFYVPLVKNNDLISIYPNPSDGNVYIHTTKQPAGDASVNVYNMLGQQVYTTADVPANGYVHLPLPGGTYVLKYFSGAEYAVQRVVIER